MKLPLAFIVILVPLTLGNATLASARCGDKAGFRNPVETTIALSTSRPRPAYYLRTSVFVLMFSADALIRKVEELDRTGKHAVLLHALKADQPLTDDTDIFKYAFDLPREVETLNFAVAALLDEGKGTLTAIRALDGSAPSEGILIRGDTVVGNVTYSRTYCTRTGTQLHRVQDMYD